MLRPSSVCRKGPREEVFSTFGPIRPIDPGAEHGHPLPVKQLPGGMRYVAAAVAVAVAACGSPLAPSPDRAGFASGPRAGLSSMSLPSPSPVPAAGHELYGFVPYWEMDDTIAAHVAASPLTTLGLFSVSSTSKGPLDTAQRGYRQITGDVGAAMIRAAHRRGTRVELVFTSFGTSRNTAFFARTSVQDATIASLVALVGRLRVDGVDVDVESLDIGLVDAYGAFVGRLRSALVAARPGATVSVATGPGPTGVAMAAAALAAGADRVFLMGYDYRTGSSEPGAVSPIARADDGASLSGTLDLYAAMGIPPQRLLLGLPLYGMAWPVTGPTVGAPATGNGVAWIPRRHADVLTGPGVTPSNDPLEGVDVYFVGSDGSLAPPSPMPSPDPQPDGRAWSAVYVDSPATLGRKLGLGESRCLVGAGFWAIGYERGLPSYTALMNRFVAGDVAPS